MSVKELKNITGISRSTLQNYEAGLRQPSLDNIKKMATALRILSAFLAALTGLQDNVSPGFLSFSSHGLHFAMGKRDNDHTTPDKLSLVHIIDDLLSLKVNQAIYDDLMSPTYN
jgi:transcriptional regulator with XRE-family HTH domain